MHLPVVESYEPSLFRKWYDGPVLILDTMCASIDHGHATRVVFQYIKEIDEFLEEKVPRPFAGTIFLIVPEQSYLKLNEKYKELDVRLLKM